MQLRLKPRTNRNSAGRNFVIKTFAILIVFLLGIFLLDKIDLPVPNKLIKHQISNDKLKTLK